MIRSAPPFRTLLLVSTAMALFAANSLLARAALRSADIDAAGFAAVRIVTGALALWLLTSFGREGAGAARRHGSFRSAFALCGYGFAFSFAYLSLNAATGALILFATVQITMLAVGMARGERPGSPEWVGLALAFTGLMYLVSPGLTAPSPVGALLMAAAGAGWGCYSLGARGVRSPIAATAGNFARAVPLAAGALIVFWAFDRPHASWRGMALAATSGAITSGLGYAIWYAASKDLRTSLAAIVQLTVPVLTAAAGVMLLGEQLTWRLGVAAAAILGGVALAFAGKVR
jgi:drug/metabolite transporter (DMT)-like permease